MKLIKACESAKRKRRSTQVNKEALPGREGLIKASTQKPTDMKAFVYSLDAFISLLISVFAIQLLITSLTYLDFKEPLMFKAKILATDLARMVAEKAAMPGSHITDCYSLSRVIPPQYSYAISDVKGLIKGCYRGNVANPKMIRASASAIVLDYKEKDVAPPSYPICSLKDMQQPQPGELKIDRIQVVVAI